MMNVRALALFARQSPLLLARQRALLPNIYDVVIFTLIFAVFVAIFHGAQEMNAPLAKLTASPVVLEARYLPEYALRTTLRMFAALFVSLLFTFLVAPVAAKSRKAELVIVPALDILQSVPVLGFLTFTVVFFMNLFPRSELGGECAAIFAIFTAQAWNMTFSVYQSLRTIPNDLCEVSRNFRFSSWLRFWRLELPFAMPGLVWNMMLSMSGSWFFVVASESITVGQTSITLPGIGSWLALAIANRDIHAVILAVATMGIVILIYDQIVFRPIVAWADKFRFEMTASGPRPQSWLYDFVRRTRLVRRLMTPIEWLSSHLVVADLPVPALPNIERRLPPVCRKIGKWAGDALWYAAVGVGVIWALIQIVGYIQASLGIADFRATFWLGFLTFMRVIILTALASVIWVPIGVWIGLRPRFAEWVQPAAQFLAAFPANVLFPIAVVAIVDWNLNPNIWLSPLMILGTQWYILFNVIAGASAFPSDLREAATLYRLRSWLWWKKVILPGIFPYYVTGALTAAGGCWNASIVAEVASWGTKQLRAQGLGAYIADATGAGDYPRVVLGIAVMSIFVVGFNRLFWRPLYGFAERRLRFD